jgi:hypothetical protein
VEEFERKVLVLELAKDIWNIRRLINGIVSKKEKEFAELEALHDESAHKYPEPVGSDTI